MTSAPTSPAGADAAATSARSAPTGPAPAAPPLSEGPPARRPGGSPAADAHDHGLLPAEAYVACLAGLPGMGPVRLNAVLAVDGPEQAWCRLREGRRWSDPAVLTALGPRGEHLFVTWHRAAAAADIVSEWRRVVTAGVGVAARGAASYPPALADDVEAPAVVFFLGSPEVIAGPRVAIVGTRRCTATGRSVAHELGRGLAASGVAVVSGLATGIDAAAHHGALAVEGAPPIGVAGNGLDIVYPPNQGDLWRAVATTGVLLSEAPPGRPPERWRFPARNRIIAALADAVVVVESHLRGGSLHTVDEADRRSVDVLAVPGSVRSSASAGTNGLLAEGRTPVTCVDDVLMALGLGPAGRRRRPERTPPSSGDDRVLDALGWQPTTLDQLVLRTGHAVGEVALALQRLEDGGWARRSGGWYERVAGGDA